MNSDRDKLPLGRLAVLAGVAVLAAAVGGGWPTWHWTGRQGLLAMAVGASAALLAFAAALAVTMGAARRGRGGLAMAFLAAGPVRFGLTLGLVLAVWWWIDCPPTVLLVWAVGFYLLLLAAEVAWLAGVLKPSAGRTT